MKLTRLRIHRYRDVLPGTSLVFSPSLNLVLGGNGTGRTTLLELLAHVIASDFSGLISEEFSLEYELAFPGMGLHVEVSNTLPTDEPEPEASSEGPALMPLRELAAAPPPMRPAMRLTLRLEEPGAELVMRADAEGVSWEVEGKPAYAQKMHWSLLDRTVWVVLFMTAQRLEPEYKDRLKELLRRTFLLAPARFDEALGTFERIGTTQYAMEMRGEEVFPLGLMSLPTWLPGLLRERADQAVPAGLLDIRHDEVEHGFLAKFVALAGLQAGRFRVELLDRRSYEGGGRLEFGRFGFSFIRRDGTVLSLAQLSHGQKRLLSFLYYLDVNEDFVLADELATGLHPRWVEACMRELGGRQCFLTSHNPVLFEHVPLRSVHAVHTSLVHCALELHEGRECKAWSNPGEEKARQLFTALQREDTPPGHVLRTLGLW